MFQKSKRRLILADDLDFHLHIDAAFLTGFVADFFAPSDVTSC
jgi:hypothetical protein